MLKQNVRCINNTIWKCFKINCLFVSKWFHSTSKNSPNSVKQSADENFSLYSSFKKHHFSCPFLIPSFNSTVYLCFRPHQEL